MAARAGGYIAGPRPLYASMRMGRKMPCCMLLPPLASYFGRGPAYYRFTGYRVATADYETWTGKQLTTTNPSGLPVVNVAVVAFFDL